MQLVLSYHDRITTTSLIVAEIFEKRHDNVLRSIQDLDCSDEFRLLNFEESSYKNSQNKQQPMFFITKDGFMMLAMGFSGQVAAKFKEAFIKAFNQMEQALFKAKTPQLIPVYQARILSSSSKECPTNRWCIFDQASEIMLLIEKEVGSVNQFDLADGSIGIHWSKYREGKSWTKTVSQYYHCFADKRGKQLSNCYDYAELEHFKVWLKSAYQQKHLGDYLRNKYKKDSMMLPRVEKFLPKLLPSRRPV